MSHLVESVGSLVQGRRNGESLIVDTGDGQIEIQIYEIRSSSVRVRVTAPTRFIIHRKEKLQAMQASDIEAMCDDIAPVVA